MVFRVLVAGGRGWVDYVRLRDSALVNRLPHVEIITAGGPGISALAASYSVRIPVVTTHPDSEDYRLGPTLG